jgi:flagellar biosynthesis protein FliR
MTFEIPMQPLVLGGLVASRVGTFMMAVPILGIRGVPAPVKIALSLWLSVVVATQLTSAPIPLTPGALVLGMLRESLVGVSMAFIVVIFFAAVQFAGQILSIQIGFAMVNVVDPQSQTNVSVISQIYNIIAVLIFLAVDGPLILVRAIEESFLAVPPGGVALSQAGIFEVARSAGSIFSLGFQIALPVVVTLFLVSLSMGILGRTVPQLNILVVGFPIKIMVGIIMVTACVPLFANWVLDALADLPQNLAGVGSAVGGGR